MRVYQVPSHTRLWLVLAVFACSLPQLLSGPIWQSVLLAMVVVLRVQVDRQRLRLPGRWLRGALMLVAVALTWYSFGRLYGPEAGVALLVSLFALKYLEVIEQRDAYVVIVLGYFVCATALLFERGPVMFLFVLFCMLMLTACLIGINHSDTRARPAAHLKYAAGILLQAVPLMAVLFLLVPRVAPLWNMQLDTGKARTGMSDSMSPGEISDLSESSALAFRVAFDGPLPVPSERYWRGLTLTHFDGRTWQQALPRGMNRDDYLYGGRGEGPHWYQSLRDRGSSGNSYRYQLIMEPTQRRWLFAMAVPLLEQGQAALARDMRLVADSSVAQRSAYRITSVTGLRSAIPLDKEERSLMLSLPERSYGRRARGLAQQWQLESDGPEQIVQRALGHFRQQPFHYTLKPPPLTADPVDEFLFATRRGFCEHYASSFTFLMRAAGVPARVVVGYQGGEQNSLGSHLLVRQYDAHAWSEVWLPGQGWTRVDPTAAVAPERVELGLRAALANSTDTSGMLDELHSFAQGGWMGRLQLWADYVDFRWQTWILGYDNRFQLDVLGQLLGKVTPLRIAGALIVAVTVLLGVYMLVLLKQAGSTRQTLLEREYWRVHGRISRSCGKSLPEGLGPDGLVREVAASRPQAAEVAGNWARYYQQLLYNPSFSVGKAQIRHLRSLRNRLYKLLD